MTLLVTGGAGFIGSNFILNWLTGNQEPIINLDKLTYAGNLINLQSVQDSTRYMFLHGDINDSHLLVNLFKNHKIRAVIHFAAESHVDRSIESPSAFVQTNIVGTLRLLEASRFYYSHLKDVHKQNFRFIHISTDEVFGSLSKDALPFTETNRYEPNSPYSASKASADHLVRSYHHTYGLPTIISNCSNNYGPYQFPEKLIPLCIDSALKNQPIPIYGDGQQIRDWLYVSDHCHAITSILEKGKIGESYNIGGGIDKTNLDVVKNICLILDKIKPRADSRSYLEQIAYVSDRPGHDRRYAINSSKIQKELGWKPTETFKSGLEKTIHWYLDNQAWINNLSQKNILSTITKETV